MPLRKSRKKTSEFFSKTIKSLKSMLVYHGSQTINTQTQQCNPFSCSSRKFQGKDEFYSDRWTMDHDQLYDEQGNISMQDKVIVVSSSNNNIDEQCSKTKKKQQQGEVRDEKEAYSGAGCLKLNKQGGRCSSYRVISQRMKELEMMEFKDVDHVLDVEEVLHYYSRLRSPVYLDIVDSFFTDMYSELLHKPQRNCLHASKRRLGPLKLPTAAV